MKHTDPPLLQHERYRNAVALHGPEIGRFVAGYESDPARRQELLQDVHLAIWQSMEGFRGQCSLRTWVYRVAHNVGVTHVQKSLRRAERHAVALDEAEHHADERADTSHTERRIDLERVMRLVHSLGAVDRQVMLLYLEDLDAASIAEVTGLTPGSVATRIHRIKAALAARLHARNNT